MRSRSAFEHVIPDPELPTPPVSVPIKNKPPNSSRNSKTFRSCQEKITLRAWRLSSYPMVFITWAKPICLNTHTWHVGVHNNHIMSNYFGVVQPVLHHNSPNNSTLRSPWSWLSPIGFSLQRYTFPSALGPLAPNSRKAHF